MELKIITLFLLLVAMTHVISAVPTRELYTRIEGYFINYVTGFQALCHFVTVPFDYIF